MNVSYQLPFELSRGFLSTRLDDKPESTKRTTQMQSELCQTFLHDFGKIHLTFRKTWKKIISKAFVNSKIEIPFPVSI